MRYGQATRRVSCLRRHKRVHLQPWATGHVCAHCLKLPRSASCPCATTPPRTRPPPSDSDRERNSASGFCLLGTPTRNLGRARARDPLTVRAHRPTYRTHSAQANLISAHRHIHAAFCQRDVRGRPGWSSLSYSSSCSSQLSLLLSQSSAHLIRTS